MPKAKKVVPEYAPVEPKEYDRKDPLPGPDESEAEVVTKPVSKVKQTSFDVHNAGGTHMRTYSVEQHGKDAGDLAEEYAKKIGGSVK